MERVKRGKRGKREDGDWVAEGLGGKWGVLNCCGSRILADNSKIYGLYGYGRSQIFRRPLNRIYRGRGGIEGKVVFVPAKSTSVQGRVLSETSIE